MYWCGTIKSPSPRGGVGAVSESLSCSKVRGESECDAEWNDDAEAEETAADDVISAAERSGMPRKAT